MTAKVEVRGWGLTEQSIALTQDGITKVYTFDKQTTADLAKLFTHRAEKMK